MSHEFPEPSEPPDRADSAGASGGSPQPGSAGSAGSAGSTDSGNQSPDSPNVARIFSGGDGREWMVREMPPPVYDRRRGPSLVFSADDVWRRVRNYPANWRERTDAELYEISLGV